MSKLLDLGSFAAHLEDATRQAGFTVERRDGLDLYVVLHGDSVRCNLDKAFSAYQISPHHRDDIVQVHVNALRSVPPPPPPPTEEQAAQSLLPMLNPPCWLEREYRPKQ